MRTILKEQMKVYVVYYTWIYMMCETFDGVQAIYKNKEDAIKAVNELKKNGDKEAYFEEMEVK